MLKQAQHLLVTFFPCDYHFISSLHRTLISQVRDNSKMHSIYRKRKVSLNHNTVLQQFAIFNGVACSSGGRVVCSLCRRKRTYEALENFTPFLSKFGAQEAIDQDVCGGIEHQQKVADTYCDH